MPYTDARGRPELVADESLKGGSAGWRVVPASEDQDEPRAGARAAGTPPAVRPGAPGPGAAAVRA